MDTIDIPFHVVPALFADAATRGEFRPLIDVDTSKGRPELIYRPPAAITLEQGPPLRPQLSDIGTILAEMDRRKLDAAAISPPPQLFAYWTPPELGERIARTVNDGLAEMARAQPDRFLPLASLPLQDGLRGATLCSHVNGVDLDIAGIEPVFAAAERLDVALFLHPQNTGDLTRLADYHLWNLIGFPMETATAGARLLLSGVFEKFPGLKIVLAHGGGFLPYQLGRLDHGYEVRPELRKRLPRAPSAYLGNLYCDSLTHDTLALRFLIDRFGADHVVLGTDHPFDMGTDTPVDSVTELGIANAARRAILGGTLARLLKVG